MSGTREIHFEDTVYDFLKESRHYTTRKSIDFNLDYILDIELHEQFITETQPDTWLKSPQGRAEDVLLAATYKLSDNFGVRAGYRILEGGADNDKVYGFALFHYASVGLSISF